MTKGVYMPKRTGGNGEHVVTMREVAKAAGVSIKTVSNVVNDYEFVSQATRDKVNKAIVELGYTVNVSARNLRRGQTGIIGFPICRCRISRSCHRWSSKKRRKSVCA